MRLILGSQSARRKEILSFFTYPFEVLFSGFAEESVPFEDDPIAYAEALSKGKGAALCSLYPEALILTADTIVYKEGKVFGKPSCNEEAMAMLRELNGAWHTVYTAVTARHGEKERTLCTQTNVLFHKVSEKELLEYHEAFKATDKAGGYGIQTGGSLIVKRIEGCFYNVMGLPLSATRDVLREMGVDLWHYLV